MKIRVLIIACIFLLTRNIQAQMFTFEKIPDWVEIIDTTVETLVSKYDVNAGFYASLVDYQINLKEEAEFNHEITNVVSFSGITNASQLMVSFDTAYQKLLIHHLYIWRNGEKIDRTKELSFEIVNNEQNLHNGIYTGLISAYDILEDIRKDDKIDFAYTIVGFNPIFEKEKYLLIPLQFINPVDYFYLSVLYPSDKDYQYNCVNCDSSVMKTFVENGTKQIEIEYTNLEAIDLEESMTPWTIPYNYFILSSFHSWKEVNEWAKRVFQIDENVNVDAVFEELFNGNESQVEKINKIIDYVQDDIRYMGIESGIGSIKPFPPDQVVKQRFGDCKDKSLLLVTLLKKIGIEDAFPALVSVNLNEAVDDLLPGGAVFNHCIMTFDYNDTTYWVDPTISQQGGDFRKLFNTDYKKALIIGKPQDSLQNINIVHTENEYNVIEELNINSFSEPALLTIKSIRKGMEADHRRFFLEHYSTRDLTNSVTNNLTLLFPTAIPDGEVLIHDDIENNILTTEYSYKVDEFWQDGDKNNNQTRGLWLFRFEPLLIYQYLSVSSCEERKYDFYLNYPLNINYKMIFNFPKKMIIDDDIDIFDTDVFYYEEKIEQISEQSVQIDYHFRIKTDHINAKNYREICEIKNTIVREIPVVFYFPK